MIRDGNAAATGTVVRDFYGGQDRWIRGTDDLLILPLQSGTQWDSLAHIVFERQIYNGYDATDVGSKGAIRNDIAQARDRVVGRGVLLDIPRSRGFRGWSRASRSMPRISRSRARQQGVEVGRGDIVLIRTGQLAQCRAAGAWGAYAGGAAPGLALDTATWIHERELAAIATDTWGAEVLPNETPDVFQPMHIILIVHMGLLIGEIFDLEALAEDCAADGTYEFLFSAPPLPITGGVGSPSTRSRSSSGLPPAQPPPDDLPDPSDRRHRVPEPEQRPVSAQPRPKDWPLRTTQMGPCPDDRRRIDDLVHPVPADLVRAGCRHGQLEGVDVGHPREVDACPFYVPDQPERSRVQLDDLEAAVTRVIFEFDVEDAAVRGRLEQGPKRGQAGLDVGERDRHVRARVGELRRIHPDAASGDHRFDLARPVHEPVDEDRRRHVAGDPLLERVRNAHGGGFRHAPPCIVTGRDEEALGLECTVMPCRFGGLQEPLA